MTYVHVMMTFMNLTFYTIQDERFHMQYKGEEKQHFNKQSINFVSSNVNKIRGHNKKP